MVDRSSITTIYINSKDAASGTINNFSYILPQGIPVATEYYISSVSVPFSQYVTVYKPITGTFAQFRMMDSGGPFTVSIPPGNYSAYALATVVQEAIQTGSGNSNYLVLYNANTYSYSILNSTLGFTFSILWGSTSNQHPSQNISLSLGFPVEDLTGGGEYNSTQAATSSGTSYNYYIKSQCLTLNGSYAYFNGVKDSVICQVPINASTGGLIQFVNPIGEWIPLRAINLNNIDVQLVDDYNLPIDTNGLNWTFTLFIRNRSY
jgi:hypothetical protein